MKLSFADVGNSRILEGSSGDGAGTLTVTSVNGFLYVTTRNVTLKPSGLSNKGEWAKPMTLGFEGAMKIESSRLLSMAGSRRTSDRYSFSVKRLSYWG